MRRLATLLAAAALLAATADARPADSLLVRIAQRPDSASRAALYDQLAAELGDAAREIEARRLTQNPTGDGYARALARHYDNRGRDLRHQGQYAAALASHTLARQIAEANRLADLLPRVYNNIGAAYRRIDDYTQGIHYHLLALQAADDIGDETTAAHSLNSIGNVHLAMHEHGKALEYFRRSIKRGGGETNPRNMAINCNNIGAAYEQIDSLALAEKHYQKSLQYNIAANDQKGIAIVYSSLGNVLYKRGRYADALRHYTRAAQLHAAHTEPGYHAAAVKDMAAAHLQLGNLAAADSLLDQALRMSRRLADKSLAMEACRLKSALLERQKRHREALRYERLRIQFFDSVWDQQKSNSIIKLQAAYDAQKKMEAIDRLQMQNQLNQSEIKRKQIENYALYTLAAAMLAVLGLTLRQYKIKRRSMAALSERAAVISRQNTELQAQKERIERINERTADSLDYARGIQEALLPTDGDLRRLFASHFVLSLPHSRVSGDFYWAYPKEDRLLFAAADCTGHGVPGALLSMLGISFLNDLAQGPDLGSAAQYLEALRRRVVATLGRRDGERGPHDGISIALCVHQPARHNLQFAGAQSSIAYANTSRQIVEVKGGRTPIGLSIKDFPFEDVDIDTRQIETLYLYSDGLADQLGGTSEKRFRKAHFFSVLQTAADQPLDRQHDALSRALADWQGANEQTDDILVLGLRLRG